MTVLNDLDRFHLAMDVINRLPPPNAGADDKRAALKRQLEQKLVEHKKYIGLNGEDLPEIRLWRWVPG